MRLARCIVIGLAAASLTPAADPTFLKRYLPDVQAAANELTAGSHGTLYRPAFGAGDSQAGRLKGVARYGELTVAPAGASAIVSYRAEEQIYFILEGNGTLLYDDQKVPVKKNDYVYLPIGIRHGIANPSNQPYGYS